MERRAEAASLNEDRGQAFIREHGCKVTTASPTSAYSTDTEDVHANRYLRVRDRSINSLLCKDVRSWFIATLGTALLGCSEPSFVQGSQLAGLTSLNAVNG